MKKIAFSALLFLMSLFFLSGCNSEKKYLDANFSGNLNGEAVSFVRKDGFYNVVSNNKEIGYLEFSPSYQEEDTPPMIVIKNESKANFSLRIPALGFEKEKANITLNINGLDLNPEIIETDDVIGDVNVYYYVYSFTYQYPEDISSYDLLNIVLTINYE